MEACASERKVPAGTANLKSEYIIVDHVRQLNLEFVTQEDKNKVDKSNQRSASPGGPPRKKLKGQNKNRPRDVKIPKCEKLCFKMSIEGSCPYGTDCAYSHNVDSYLAKKPPDLGENCYLFDTLGRCPYGFSCRFSSKHIVDGKNVCNDALWDKLKDKPRTQNVLSHDVQVLLRKRTYDFSKADKVLKIIQNEQWKAKFKNAEVIKGDADGSNRSVLSVVPYSRENVSLRELNSDQTSDNVPAINSPSIPVEDAHECAQKLLGPCPDEDVIHLKPCEVKKVDFRDKLYLAPLTTVGNLPFRRICKEFGADITCGEMAVATSLLQAQHSEWALLRRHYTEDIFGVQICGAHPDVMVRCAQLLSEKVSVDFIDVNMGCPLDFVYKKGSGCGLMTKQKKLENMIYGMSLVSQIPITLKMRTGVFEGTKLAHSLIKKIHYLKDCISLITVHGRSREQRYTKSADWDYVNVCCEAAHPIPFFGNGDVLSYEDYNLHRKETDVQGIMIARGALIKPWIFTEIKEQRHWDISASERFDFIKKYVNYGLEHWGSDTEGVEKTRRFLLEWLSFLYRYIPAGLLECLPQHINERPPPYFGRNDLETLMASPSCADWIKISEMLLGPVPESFSFLPKHKANAYS